MKVVNGQERNWTQVLFQSCAFLIEPCCRFSSVKQQTENSDPKKPHKATGKVWESYLGDHMQWTLKL